MPLPVSYAYKWRTLSAAAAVMTLELSAAPLPTQDRTRAAGISRSCVRPRTLCPGVFVFYKRQMADKEKNDRQLDSIGACGVPARVRTTLRHRDPPPSCADAGVVRVARGGVLHCPASNASRPAAAWHCHCAS